MRALRLAQLVALAGALLACAPEAPPTETPAPPEPTPSMPILESEAGGSGGAEGEGALGPNKLTGVPGIDRAQELEVRVLDVKGTGRVGSDPITVGLGASQLLNRWMLTDAASEYEITVKSPLMPDGVVRLKDQAAFAIERPTLGTLPGFRIFGGQAFFYLPHLPQGKLSVLTPAGPLITGGAVFTVSVSPDFQVLVTCREGTVYLTGHQNSVAQPGQVLVADPLGRGHIYPMTPNEASVFADRWMKIMTEESAPVLEANLPGRLAAWSAVNAHREPDRARFLALWFRQARTLLGDKAPPVEVWAAPLQAEVSGSVWFPTYPSPGLMGEFQ